MRRRMLKPSSVMCYLPMYPISFAAKCNAVFIALVCTLVSDKSEVREIAGIIMPALWGCNGFDGMGTSRVASRDVTLVKQRTAH